MLKKILFLLSALFFCINVFSSEIVQQKPKWLDYDIPQEIEHIILSYCDLADLNSLYQACKHINGIDTLICPTHQEINHKCSSIHLSDLTKDYDRCTHILHCIANRTNLTNPVKFNSQSEENLFFMIYFLHKENREQLIQTAHPTVKQELFSNKLRRDYYQYDASNTYDLLLATIQKKKLSGLSRFYKLLITIFNIQCNFYRIVSNIAKTTLKKFI
jgi:hypothetical protein